MAPETAPAPDVASIARDVLRDARLAQNLLVCGHRPDRRIPGCCSTRPGRLAGDHWNDRRRRYDSGGGSRRPDGSKTARQVSRLPQVGPGGLYNLKLILFLERAGSWFLQSGIQEPSGGVARYYRTDSSRTRPSQMKLLAMRRAHCLPVARMLEGARSTTAMRRYAAGNYLTDQAWDSSSNAFPFEPNLSLTYFFDTGIIVRGLLTASRRTGSRSRTRAREAALHGLRFPG